MVVAYPLDLSYHEKVLTIWDLKGSVTASGLDGYIVIFYFIVCYLLNIVLFYSKYDVCSRM